jgi:hypothetical protein
MVSPVATQIEVQKANVEKLVASHEVNVLKRSGEIQIKAS